MKNPQTKKKSKRDQKRDNRLRALVRRLDKAFRDQSIPEAKRVRAIDRIIGALHAEFGPKAQ